MTPPAPLRLFEGTGIELEYMIVDAETLAVRPVADELLKRAGGGYEKEVDLGPVAWSNELALHVIELKTNGPAATLKGLGATFQEHVRKVNDLLRPMRARLMPTGMHPWMDPDDELRLWPHEDNAIYAAFDRIFNCRGHGWANLQSTHINLPFSGDEEFGRLHAAIRLVLPILPALAASSPIVEGAPTGFLDTRLEVYRNNSNRVPSVVGSVIPERVFTRADYEGKLLQSIYDDLAPLDPGGIIRHEWVNARGCIARFDRMAIEIRLLDIQECPAADVGVAKAVIGAVRALVEEKTCRFEDQMSWSEGALEPILLEGIRSAGEGIIEDAGYLRAMGYAEGAPCRAMELWRHLLETVLAVEGSARDAAGRDLYSVLMQHGSLARRIQTAAGPRPSRERLTSVYRELCRCLADGVFFIPDDV